MGWGVKEYVAFGTTMLFNAATAGPLTPNPPHCDENRPMCYITLGVLAGLGGVIGGLILCACCCGKKSSREEAAPLVT